MESTIEIYENLVKSIGASETAAKLEALTADDDEEDMEFILEDTKSLLAESRASTKSIKAIVKKLKDFAILDDGGSASTDINQLTENVISLISEQLEQCEVKCDFGDLPQVSCNPGEVGQVIINLLLNSVHACNQAEKPLICLETKYEDGEVSVTVADNGCGIEEDDLTKVFDPFFYNERRRRRNWTWPVDVIRYCQKTRRRSFHSQQNWRGHNGNIPNSNGA